MIAGYVATHAVSGQDNPYKVKLETLKGLKSQSTDTDAIKVTVSTSMFDEEKRIFVGVLCGIEAAELQLKSTDVAHLPVLLTTGNVDTRERVIFGLEKCFDCVITSLELPDVELRWMSAMWAGLQISVDEEERDEENNDDHEETNKAKKATKRKMQTKKKSSKKKQEEFKMWFKVPSKEEDVKEKIRYVSSTFPMHQIRDVWRNIHSGSDVEFSDNEMEKFHSELSKYTMSQMKLDTNNLELIQIYLPFLKAVKTGIVRIEKCDHVKVVLRYLTELCQSNVVQTDPTLAASVQDGGATMGWA